MPRPVILDCDPGTDDALAILLALASSELDIQAITVVGGNTSLEASLSHATSLTALANKPVPVHPGAPRSLIGSFTPSPSFAGADVLSSLGLPAGGPPMKECAADAIRRIARTSAEQVTLVGIGPATNLALALATEPAVLANVREIVLMAGASGEGNVSPAAEFNAWSDPEALAIVMGCGRPIVMVTLELTDQAVATPGRLDAWRRRAPGRSLQMACEIQSSAPASTHTGGVGVALHDPCAVAWLIRPDLFTGTRCHVEVDLGPGASRGRTLIDRWGCSKAAPNAIVLQTLDSDRFFDLLGDRLALLP